MGNDPLVVERYRDAAWISRTWPRGRTRFEAYDGKELRSTRSFAVCGEPSQPGSANISRRSGRCLSFHDRKPETNAIVAHAMARVAYIQAGSRQGLMPMPSRLVSLAILVYWCVAAFCLLNWEVLPELSLGYPPDLRAIAAAGDSSKPVVWDIQVVDNPASPEVTRSVGEAVTSSKRLHDGWFELGSEVNFDAGGLLRNTPLGTKAQRSDRTLERLSRRSCGQPAELRSEGEAAAVLRKPVHGQGQLETRDHGSGFRGTCSSS